jgi:protein-tyrosine phosphatase
MCRIAAADGIKTIVATPHFRPGMYDCNDVGRHVAVLQKEILSQGIDLTILAGADVSVTPELVYHVEEDRRLTINDTGRYVLAELPHEAVPSGWDRFLLSLRERGITPILTHPERNRWFLNHPQALVSFVLAGGLVQITAMSVTGAIGSDVRDLCHFLLRRNLVHVIASDAHSVDKRPPVLSEAFDVAKSIIGQAAALRLVLDNPQTIIEGKSIDAPEPVMMNAKKRSWFQKVLDM